MISQYISYTLDFPIAPFCSSTPAYGDKVRPPQASIFSNQFKGLCFLLPLFRPVSLFFSFHFTFLPIFFFLCPLYLFSFPKLNQKSRKRGKLTCVKFFKTKVIKCKKLANFFTVKIAKNQRLGRRFGGAVDRLLARSGRVTQTLTRLSSVRYFISRPGT